MSYAQKNRTLHCVLITALLSLRILMPAGYMPASAGGGLLFELCPEGLPAAIATAFAPGNRSHHHGHEEDSTSSADRCPIGHMLCLSAAFDQPGVTPWLAPARSFVAAAPRSLLRSTHVEYLSRAPPA